LLQAGEVQLGGGDCFIDGGVSNQRRLALKPPR